MSSSTSSGRAGAATVSVAMDAGCGGGSIIATPRLVVQFLYIVVCRVEINPDSAELPLALAGHVEIKHNSQSYQICVKNLYITTYPIR